MKWRRKREDDMQEELASLASIARDETGDARELGNLTRVAEEAREAWGWTWLDRLSHDLRYAVRSLRTRPAFTLVALATLALAIGANTTIFTAVNSVFLTPLPVKNHAELRLLTWRSAKRSFGGRFLQQPMWDTNFLNRGEGLRYFSYAAFTNLRDHNSSFAELVCTRFSPPVNLPDGTAVGVQSVTGNFFQTLGLGAALGRVLTPDDDRPGAAPAIVISSRVWLNSFAGDQSVLGRTVKWGPFDATIVGVLPPEFFGLDPGGNYGVTAPLSAAIAMTPAIRDPHNWNACQTVLATLRPGAAVAPAEAESSALVRDTILADPPKDAWEPPRVSVTSFERGFDTLRRAASQPFRLLMATAGIILLIACANIAGLLLARGTARQKEIATRLALGASRSRVIRQLMTESLLLSMAGAVAGVAIAYAASPLLPRLFQQFNYYQFNNLGLQFHPDWRVVAFSVALAAITGALFGLGPAFRAAKVGLIAMIKMSAAVTGRFRFLSGKSALTVQVALSTVLLVGAGLFLRTLSNLRSVPMGYDPGGLVYFTVQPTANRQEFVARVRSTLDALPGVTSTSVSMWPLFTSAPDTYFDVCIPGDVPKNFDDRFADSDYVLPQFFDTWRVPFLRGHDFTTSDAPGSVIVNEAFVKRYLRNTADPVGQSVALGPRCTASTIIGVVANSTDRPRIATRPFVYMRYTYQPTQLTFTVRTAANPQTLIAAMQKIVAGLNTRIFEPVTTGVDYRDRTMIQERLFTVLLAAFGGLALFIACIGIYGMTTYMVTRRTAEIGIRMSLGARRSDVVRMVIRESVAPMGAGIAAGIAAAWLLAKLVSTVLFGVSPADPWSIAAAAMVLLLTAGMAAAMPARTASRIDPTQALREL